MYDVADTVKNIKTVAKQQGISITDLLAAAGLNKNTLSTMAKRGSWIAADSLAEIADILHVSVDVLLGRDPEENENAPIVADRSELAAALSKLSPSEAALMTDLAAALAAKSQSPPPRGDQ